MYALQAAACRQQSGTQEARPVTDADRAAVLTTFGKKATTALIFDFDQPATYGVWQVGADGASRLLVFEGPVAKPYRITPGTDTNIVVVLAAAK